MNRFIRLNITVEGQTEERFVKQSLAPWLGFYNLSTDVRCVLTSRDKHRHYRGGMSSFRKVKSDIETWLKSDNHAEARFTSMFDLYRLPDDFPGYDTARICTDPYEKVRILEEALGEEIGDRRFVPYIQLHEFETLLFAQPDLLLSEYIGCQKQVAQLEAMLIPVHYNPELINDRPESSPSKRIIHLIPGYEGNKVTVGASIAGLIGIEKLKQSCRHFKEWVDHLEHLGEE